MTDRRGFIVRSTLTIASAIAATTATPFADAATARNNLPAGAVSPPMDWDQTKGLPITEVASLRWLCNAIALTSSGRRFVSLPRWQTNEDTISVAELRADGSLAPFPGGEWNTWTPGKPAANAFICVNTVHIFDDNTLWVVDQGQWQGKLVDKDACKLLQFDTETKKLLRRITFDEKILPVDQGAMINDLRLDKETIYLTDSGAGAIITVDLTTNKMLRRLAMDQSTKAQPSRPPIGEGGKDLLQANGQILEVNSDPIEISPDGKWLYYQALSGPLYRVHTKSLRDPHLSEAQLSKQIELVYDTPPLTGTAIDSAGNFYLAEMDRPRISVYTVDKKLVVLAEDDRLWGPDALFISNRRELYIPVPQTTRLAANRGPNGVDGVKRPWKIYKLSLPEWLGSREAVPPVDLAG